MFFSERKTVLYKRKRPTGLSPISRPDAVWQSSKMSTNSHLSVHVEDAVTNRGVESFMQITLIILYISSFLVARNFYNSVLMLFLNLYFTF